MFHDDSTASMKVYGDFAYCFGCRVSVPVSELNLPSKVVSKEVTNIKEKFDYINSLPIKKIRGVEVPYDSEGFYIRWPRNKFYKKRLFSGKSKYIGPSGHKVPLFIVPGYYKHLLIIEGELNAISLSLVIWDEYTIVSPGSAGELMKHIDYYRNYDKITIFSDYDAPGVVFGLQLKETLLRHGKKANLRLLKKDFNDILVKEGEEGLKKYFESII